MSSSGEEVRKFTSKNAVGNTMSSSFSHLWNMNLVRQWVSLKRFRTSGVKGNSIYWNIKGKQSQRDITLQIQYSPDALDGMLGVLISPDVVFVTVDDAVSAGYSLWCRGCGTGGRWGEGGCGGEASGEVPRSGDSADGGLMSRESFSGAVERVLNTVRGWSGNADYNRMRQGNR